MRKILFLVGLLALLGGTILYKLDYTSAPVMQERNLMSTVYVLNVVSPSAQGEMQPVSHGSGVVVQLRNGHVYLVTAYHVVDDLKDHPEYVLLISRSAFEVKGDRATIVVVDPLHDLAIVEVQSLPAAKAAYICTLTPEVFDRVVAIGSPGPLHVSPAEGIISDTDALFPTLLNNMNFPMIQHTATISGGDSGGGLFKYENGGWCLQGINTQAIGDHPSINFAVGVQYLLPLLHSIK